MNADGRGRKTIFYEAGKNAFAAKWSPREDLIVFGLGIFFFRTGPAAQLALIKPDGSGFRMIIGGETNNGFPSWSPDGKRIVYRADGKQGRGLMILSIENGQTTPLNTGGQYDNFPAWSPRGDLIAFTSYRGGNYLWQRRTLRVVSGRRMDYLQQFAHGFQRRGRTDVPNSAAVWRIVCHAQGWH